MRFLAFTLCSVLSSSLAAVAQGTASAGSSSLQGLPPGELLDASLTAVPAPPLFAPLPSVAPARNPHGPVRIAGVVMASRLQTRVDPVSPALAQSTPAQGTVLLLAHINKSGTVQDLKVLRGPAALAGAAQQAVRQWIYQPYVLDGRPTEVLTTVAVDFRPKP